MSAIETIKQCARLAVIVAKTTAWALGVGLRNLGVAILNAVLGAKEQQGAERPKEKWVLSYESTGGVTIGFIRTRWDKAPTVAIATTYFAMAVREIEAISRGVADAGSSHQVMVSAIAEALHANLHVEDLGQFSRYLACFLGSDAYFAEGIAKRQDAFLVNLKLKDNKLRLRVSHRGDPHGVLLTINQVDNIHGDYGHDHIPEELMFAFDFCPQDEFLTGKVEVHDGLVTQGGQPITLTRAGWLEMSELKPCPGEFPLPRIPKVSRLPASVLD